MPVEHYSQHVYLLFTRFLAAAGFASPWAVRMPSPAVRVQRFLEGLLGVSSGEGRRPLAQDPGWADDGPLASEEHYRSLFHGVPVGLYRTTLDGRILDVNPAFVRVMRYPDRQTLLAANAADFYADPAVRAQWMALLDRDGTVTGFESQLRRFDGSTIWARANARAVRDASGRTAYLEGAVVDITDQKRGEDITRRRAAHLDALNAIIASAVSASDVRELLEAAVDGTLSALGCDIGAGWTEHVQVVRGMSRDTWSAIWRAARPGGLEGHPAIIQDWHAAAGVGSGDLAPVMAKSGVGASVSVPVQTGGQTIGGILIASPAPHVWVSEEALLVEAVGKQVGAAVQRLQLFQAIQRRTTELEAFYDLSRRLRAAGPVDEMYPIIVEQALDLLQAGHGCLALLSPDKEIFTRAYTVGLAAEQRGSTFPQAGSRSGHVVRTGATFLTADFTREPLPVWMDAYDYADWGPMAIVPLRSEHEIIGTLAIARKKSRDRPFSDAEVRLLEGIAEIAGTAIRRAGLHQNLQQAYVQMVLALAQAMEARDSYTAGHSERMVKLAEQIARKLGCPEEEVQDIRWGARLHDVGKIGIPDSVLNKPSGLTDVEWKMMRQHPVLGEEILKPVERMRAVATLVRHHQERWDGTGYPDRLQGDAIPLGSRILAVVDAYGAMTEDRPYQPARPHADALEEIRRNAGTQFDPRVVETFVAVIDSVESAEWNVGGSEGDH